MWKRKRAGCSQCGGSSGAAIPGSTETVVYRALESTLLLESGSDSGTPVNALSSQITCGMGGVKRIIYDGTYWNKDLHMTHYENAVAAILVSTYQSGDQLTTIFPICLPRQALSSTNTSSFLKKQESIAYGLNLLFSKAGYYVHSTPAGPYPYEYLTIGINDFLPILQDTVLPPLLWKVIPHTGQLCLVYNQNFVHPDPTFKIAFSVITMPIAYQGAQTIFSGNVQMTGPTSGWFADGGYVFGFGPLNTSTHVFDDPLALNPSIATYLQTLDLGDKFPMTLPNWEIHIANLGLSQVIACGERTVGCIASKYYKVQSSSLARLQKRAIVSNIQGGELSETIGVFYNTPSFSNRFQDFPVSAPVLNFNSQMNGNNIIDLELKDEWGNSMNPYPTNIPSTLAYFEKSDSVAIYPPAIYQSLDPFFSTNGPNYDCLFPYYKIDQTMIVFPRSTYILPISQLYTMNNASSISHFIRLIGS